MTLSDDTTAGSPVELLWRRTPGTWVSADAPRPSVVKLGGSSSVILVVRPLGID
jgi:hypothetical protein